MLSVEEKILLLDEVTDSARSSWQIIIAGDNYFQSWPPEDYSHPAYQGYRSLKNILSVSLMTTCYSLIETAKRSYSFHHAVADPALNKTSKTIAHFEVCFELRNKIATYRNNVVAHVNSRKSQMDWANVADIKNGDIDVFVNNAKFGVEQLARDNLVDEFALGISAPIRLHFNEYCRVTAKLDYERRMAASAK